MCGWIRVNKGLASATKGGNHLSKETGWHLWINEIISIGFHFFAVQGAIKSTQDISRAASLAGLKENDDKYHEFNSLIANQFDSYWKWRFYDLNLWKAIRGDDQTLFVKLKALNHSVMNI